MERAMKKMDLFAALIIVLLAGFALIWLIPNHVSSRHDVGDLPPTLIPYLSAGILGIAGLLLGISAWRKKELESDDTETSEAAETLGFGLNELGNLGILAVVSLIYWLVMKHAGFELASGALIITGMWYGGFRKIWIIAAAAICIPVFFSRLAWYTLDIQLP
jgi:hypothetical protein